MPCGFGEAILPRARRAIACVNVLKTSRIAIDILEDAEGRSLHLQRLVELKHWGQSLDVPPERITCSVLEAPDPAAALIDYARHNACRSHRDRGAGLLDAPALSRQRFVPGGRGGALFGDGGAHAARCRPVLSGETRPQASPTSIVTVPVPPQSGHSLFPSMRPDPWQCGQVFSPDCGVPGGTSSPGRLVLGVSDISHLCRETGPTAPHGRSSRGPIGEQNAGERVSVAGRGAPRRISGDVRRGPGTGCSSVGRPAHEARAAAPTPVTPAAEPTEAVAPPRPAPRQILDSAGPQPAARTEPSVPLPKPDEAALKTLPEGDMSPADAGTVREPESKPTERAEKRDAETRSPRRAEEPRKRGRHAGRAVARSYRGSSPLARIFGPPRRGGTIINTTSATR